MIAPHKVTGASSWFLDKYRSYCNILYAKPSDGTLRNHLHSLTVPVFCEDRGYMRMYLVSP